MMFHLLWQYCFVPVRKKNPEAMVAAFFTPILMGDSISCKLFRFSAVTSLLGAPTSWDEQAIYWASKGSSSYALKFAPFFWLLYFIGWIRALLDGDYCRQFSLLHRCLLLEHVASEAEAERYLAKGVPGLKTWNITQNMKHSASISHPRPFSH